MFINLHIVCFARADSRRQVGARATSAAASRLYHGTEPQLSDTPARDSSGLAWEIPLSEPQQNKDVNSSHPSTPGSGGETQLADRGPASEVDSLASGLEKVRVEDSPSKSLPRTSQHTEIQKKVFRLVFVFVF